MRLSITAIASLLATVQAFKDSSPFLLFSSSSLPSSLGDISQAQVQSRSQVLEVTKDFLATCPSDVYIFYVQPSLTSTELSSSAPSLKKAVLNSYVKTRYTVADAVDLNIETANELGNWVATKCGAQRRNDLGEAGVVNGPIYITNVNDALLGDKAHREETLSDSDANFDATILRRLGKEINKYTVIYSSTPAGLISSKKEDTPIIYHSAFDDVLHMDLKRDLDARDHIIRNDTDLRPLFEKYQYFNPGIFMGLLVGLLLLAILSVGINAVSSLQVSYGAFDKEMGPAAQKK